MAPPNSDSSKVSAKQPGLGKDSAEQPEPPKYLPLPELNNASAKTGGSWIVDAFRPVEDNYQYTWQGKPRSGTNLLVSLVSPEDPSQYCQAQFKKTSRDGAKYEQTKRAIGQGKRFVISDVCFVKDAKLAYVSCPLKVVVDLSSTKMDTCVDTPSSVVQPAPTATIAGSAALAGNQFFDVTALIQEVQDIREHANNRSSFIVKIYDGSIDPDTNKVKVMPLRLYFDTARAEISTGTNSAGQPVSAEAMKTLAEQYLQNKTPVSFFCISGAQDDGKFSFRSTKHTFITEAVGSKAEKMKASKELHNLSAADTVAFELQTATATRDWSLERGKETRCGLLSTFARIATGVPALDEGETIWQCNWVRINEPSPSQKIKNQFDHLWLDLTCRDDEGIIVLYITEKAVVKLTNVVDAAEFEQLHAEGRLRIPFFASIKILRRPSNRSAVQPGGLGTNATQPKQNDNAFDCYIVDAAEQNMEEIPSAASIRLLPHLSDSADRVLPAMLHMIQKSEHYTMAVQYLTQKVPPELSKAVSKSSVGVTMLRPCSRAVALVLSTQRSKVSPAGAGGHKLVTKDVVDLLYAGSAAQPDAHQKFELTSFCTLDNVTDLKLDPPKKEKEQAALISVTGVINAETDSAGQPGKGFLVDDVLLLTPEQAQALKPMLIKKLYFAALAGQISRKRAREPWSLTENPADAALCRTLGRSPTGPSLPDYSSSS